jgi:hypothetical protein
MEVRCVIKGCERAAIDLGSTIQLCPRHIDDVEEYVEKFRRNQKLLAEWTKPLKPAVKAPKPTHRPAPEKKPKPKPPAPQVTQPVL